MHRLKTLRFATVVAVLVICRAQNIGHSVNGTGDEFFAELSSLIARHQYDRAEKMVQRRLGNGGDSATTYFEIGKVYFNHEEWQRSSGFLKESLKLNGMNDEAHQLLGLDWRRLHRPNDAEAELLEAAKENPSNRTNSYFAGHQLLLNGKFETALPYLYRAIESKPLESQALQALAFAQARLGNYGLAESYYRKALGATQISEDGRYSSLVNLSVLLLLGHEPARILEGLDCARRAETLRSDAADAHFLIGKALFKLGRLQEATPELTRAAKLHPEDTKPHFLLAKIYDQLGQHDLAQEERKNLARIQGRPGQAGVATIEPVPVMPE